MLLTIAIPLLVPHATLTSEDGRWTNWRGPNRDGTSPATSLPVEWSANENVIWKTPLPSWSGATPAVWDDHIFLLSPSEVSEEAEEAAAKQKKRFGHSRHPGGKEMLLYCISAKDGSVRWTTQLDEGNKLVYKGNHASPSPVTDGEHVWTLTGNGTVSAHDYAGKLAWSTNLQERWGDFGLQWGYASSPVLHDGMLIVQVLHGMHTDEPSYLVAFDAKSGDVEWRAERPTDAPRESPDAYTTPLIVERESGLELVVTGGDYVTGHALDSGKELWRVPGLNPQRRPNYRIVPSAVLVGDILVAPTRQRPMVAIDLEGSEPPNEDSVAWTWDDRGGPDVPTPTTDGTHMYMLDDAGLVTCVDGATGEAVWGPERTEPGTYSSSPLLADGKLYLTNEEGTTVVLRAGTKFEKLAVNELDGSHTLSTPVPTPGRLYVRTGDWLYCIGSAPSDD